jgi:hypothetical protein
MERIEVRIGPGTVVRVVLITLALLAQAEAAPEQLEQFASSVLQARQSAL